MALVDIEARFSAEIPWRTCAVCHHLGGMTAKDAKILRGLMADRSVKFKALEQALREDPDSPDIPWESLSRHARGGCSAREHLR